MGFNKAIFLIIRLITELFGICDQRQFVEASFERFLISEG